MEAIRMKWGLARPPLNGRLLTDAGDFFDSIDPIGTWALRSLQCRNGASEINDPIPPLPTPPS